MTTETSAEKWLYESSRSSQTAKSVKLVQKVCSGNDEPEAGKKLRRAYIEPINLRVKIS